MPVDVSAQAAAEIEGHGLGAVGVCAGLTRKLQEYPASTVVEDQFDQVLRAIPLRVVEHDRLLGVGHVAGAVFLDPPIQAGLLQFLGVRTAGRAVDDHINPRIGESAVPIAGISPYVILEHKAPVAADSQLLAPGPSCIV